MPRKVRQLESDLCRAGFTLDTDRGKGSHGWWKHPTGVSANVSGQSGDDARPYQEQKVRKAIMEATRRSKAQEANR